MILLDYNFLSCINAIMLNLIKEHKNLDLLNVECQKNVLVEEKKRFLCENNSSRTVSDDGWADGVGQVD